jgi:hypothetical protein
VSELHGRPTAGELVEAVRALLEGSVLADGAPAGAFQVRVAVNALKVVERELAAAGEDVRRHRERLTALGFADDAELARALRRGELPADQLPEVRAWVLASVEDKLRVATPKHLDEG